MISLTDEEIAEGCVMSTDRIKRWYKDGKLHRENGPAMTATNGTWFWYQNGKQHRLDGPAVYWSSTNVFEWYYLGRRVDCSTQEEFEKQLKLKAFW